MLTPSHPILDQLRALKLDGIADAFSSSSSRMPPEISPTLNGSRSRLIGISLRTRHGFLPDPCGRNAGVLKP